MSIRRRGSSWEVSLNLEPLPRIRKSFPSPEEATAFETETVSRHRLGLPLLGAEPTSTAAPRTLRELFQKTYERYWKGSKSEDSSLSAARVVEALMGGNQPISTIDQAWIELLISRMRSRRGNHGEPVSGGTVNRKLAAVSRALRYAERMNWLDKAPRFERSKENRHRLRFLSKVEEGEFEVAFRFLGDGTIAELFTFLIDTGLRLSEAVNLRSEQADLAAGSIHIWDGTTKNDRGRSVPITHRVRDIILRRRNKETLFPDINVDGATKHFNRGKGHTSMKGDRQVVLHTLRHTFASRLVQAGVPIPTISALLGHTSLQMTMRYAHLAPANLQAAVAVLNGLNGTNSPPCISLGNTA